MTYPIDNTPTRNGELGSTLLEAGMAVGAKFIDDMHLCLGGMDHGSSGAHSNGRGSPKGAGLVTTGTTDTVGRGLFGELENGIMSAGRHGGPTSATCYSRRLGAPRVGSGAGPMPPFTLGANH